jgi:tRNA (guanine-N7-)-methyltransferase
MEGAVMTADDFQLIPEDYFRRLRREEIFPDSPDRPLEVDLGCGDGTFLTEMAAHFPERNFLGVERLLGRVRKVCKKAARRGLSNVKVLRLESAYTLEWLLPEASVSRLHLLFPDPWPKKRHRSRRIVSAEFLDGVARVLSETGEFFFKTDDRDYFEMVGELVEDWDGFEALSWPAGDFFYSETDFEKEWKEEGREIFAARFGKISE